ncbi:hypothetical protein Ait01nite_058310 [Actinoplanes italicus]|uniref:Uncharacterized protein n=1 Tax=Actinoplanes italicus TaxID=113567 RepID=A0A2T0K5Y6_9ACTN|nr:hypothetical protein [Actinoplanes italicus]PRX18377.1 hypothetical protein CLV67_113211 [Actinoplanes italicus]GIE32786.1 hypothetical protein Ait01nite_058310 [Actinoplanes italicus]
MFTQPEAAAAELLDRIRARFEDGAGRFEGRIDWEIYEGWDDGDGLWRIIVLPEAPVWSETAGATVRPVVFVGVGFNAVAHNRDGLRPAVPRFEDQPAGFPPITLVDLKGTDAAYWVGVVMNILGGRDPRLFGNGWVGFDVTLPDEAPWVAVVG